MDRFIRWGGRMSRPPQLNPGPIARGRVDVELCTNGVGTLLHSEQPVMVVGREVMQIGRGIKPFSIVLDLEMDGLVLALEFNPDVRCVPVLHRIVGGFLCDAKHGQGEGIGEGGTAVGPVDCYVHVVVTFTETIGVGSEGGGEPKSLEGRGMEVRTHSAQFAGDPHQFIAGLFDGPSVWLHVEAFQAHVETVQVLYGAVVDFLRKSFPLLFPSFSQIAARPSERFPPPPLSRQASP